jgi:hypothetical protein
MGWSTHQDDKTLRDYNSELVTLLKTMIITVDKQEGYTLPMTESQKAMVRELAKAIETDKKDIGLIHRLFYSITAPPDDSTPVGKWHDCIMCFIAASNLRPQGNFDPVTEVTRQFSKWVYLIRGACFQEFAKEDMSLQDLHR